MERLSSINQNSSKYYEGTQYDLSILCKVIKYAAKLELGDEELDDFNIDVIITCVNFLNNIYVYNLLNDEDVVTVLSSEETIEQMYHKLKDKIKHICTNLAMYNFNLFLRLLFGAKVSVDTIGYETLKVGSVVIDISKNSKLYLTVKTETSDITYIIRKKFINFLMEQHDYSLELLEDQLIEKNIPFYDMVYILIYVKAYHDNVLNTL